MKRINEFRRVPESPISRLDALLLSQVALNQDIHRFIEDAEIYCIAESLGLRVVVDESCTGLRYYRDLVDENRRDISMLQLETDIQIPSGHGVDSSCYTRQVHINTVFFIKDIIEIEENLYISGNIYHRS